MPDYADSVNEIARLYERVAADREKEGNIEGAASFKETAFNIDRVLEELKRLRRWSMPVPSSYGDISDLPESLISQLSGVKTDDLEYQIYSIIKAAGERIDTDRLLIELFRRGGQIYERRFLTNKLYRMAQKAIIHTVPSRKGVYSIHPQATSGAEGNSDQTGETQGTPIGPVASFPADLDDEIPF